MTLKELLIEKNVTQKKLAKETGISTSTISNYVSGATNISKRNLNADAPRALRRAGDFADR